MKRATVTLLAILATALGGSTVVSATPPFVVRPVPAALFEPVTFFPAASASATHRPVATTVAPSVPGITPKALALSLVGRQEFTCLDRLWERESRWRWNATNRSSGAYGIPQALPGSKMKSAGADWRTNPLTQVRWGVAYIERRYGDACAALSHSNRRGWY